MAFSVYEESIQSGEPVELFEFARDGLRWRYTSGQQAITYAGNVFEPALLERGEITLGGDKGKSGIRVTCVRDFPVANLFRVQPPSDVVLLTVIKIHYGDNTAPVGIVEWMGRVTGASWKGQKATLDCEPVATSLSRPGLRRLYQRSCPHVLYGQACGVSMASHAVSASLTSVSGAVISSITFGAHSSGHFDGGMIEYTALDGTVERRHILSHAGNNLTLSIALDVLAAGSMVTAYPGCNHTTEACRYKFSNLQNYGGFPYIPTKNPFGGGAIY